MLTRLHPPPDETPKLPSPLLRLPHPRLILSATYHPYTCGVASRHASDAAYHPYARIHPQDQKMMLLPISSLTTPYASAPPPLTILMLPQRPQDMPLMPPSTPLTPNPLSAAYHPYHQVLDP
ncbi:hypothetical protein O181_130777 [Austropuccinia psidii MF-1]|uniref:Uncharacterized protein n=1 Tax=Austropuccinia psidii MF-1 TaxID=1389203 RepID=A0A9Q3L4F8_9BASI|nr:hypothetical protein [Austropuccinia psidii MF-1]